MRFVKGILISMSFLLTALACTKTDVDLVQRDKEPITFSNPIIQPNTRAIIEGTTYPLDESFKVWAKWDKTGFKHWNTSTMYMDGLDVSHNGSYWTTKDTYYWPVEGGLTFAAYSPSTLTGASYGNVGLEINSFEVAPTSQIDILYSKRAYNCHYNLNGQDIVFNHALAKVKFNIVADYAGAHLVSLKMRNICTTGNFCENIVEDESAPDIYKTDAKKRQWTIVKGQGGTEIIADFTADFNNQTEIPLKEAGQSVVPLSSKSILVMPQRFAQSAGPMGNVIDATKAFFKIIYKDNGGTQHTSDNTTTKIASFTPVWEPGKSYSYTITIGSNKINFRADAVEEWTDGSVK